MDRCAIFVDAGHLLAQAALLCEREKRHEIRCDYGGVAGALIKYVADHSKLPLLRTYWYDGSPPHIPLREGHAWVNRLSNVNLRIGRLVGGEQKGVDVLLVRDLLMLAYERAIVTAYLLTGDQDMWDAVVTVQRLGVRVVLLGVHPGGYRHVVETNQAQILMNEVDEHEVLFDDFWRPYFRRLLSVNRAGVEQLRTLSSQPAAIECGRLLARDWYSIAIAPDSWEMVHGGPPGNRVSLTLPAAIDAELLQAATGALASIEREETRSALRRGFREELEELLRKEDSTAGEATDEKV